MATPSRRRDNDQHFKTLFRVFLKELLELSYPELLPSLRLDRCRFLDKETYTDLLRGRGLRMDLVCEIPTLDGDCRIVLVHVEVDEREPVDEEGRAFSQRIANYVMTLWLRHQRPVLPLLVSFSRHAAPGLSKREFRMEPLGEPVLRLRYRQFGVAQARAARHIRGNNPLGWALAIRMVRGAVDKVALQLACERRIVHSDLDEARQLLLIDTVKTYVKLNKEEQRSYQRSLEQQGNESIKERNMTWLERAEKRGERRGEKRGEERGEERGSKLGAAEMARRLTLTLWEGRFGKMPLRLQRVLATLTEPEVLEALCTAVGTAKDKAAAQQQLLALASGV